MKKNYVLTLCATVALVMASCTKENVNTGAEATSGTLDQITANVPSVDVKTITNDGINVLWESGDQIGLFNGATTTDDRFKSAIYQASLESASASATFTKVNDEPVGTSTDEGYYFAIYPVYSMNKWGSQKAMDAIATRRCYVNLPATQTAVVGGWDKNAGIMAAQSTTASFAFKHAVAYVKFTVDANTTPFVSMSVSSLAGVETLAGDAIAINYKEDGTLAVAPYESSQNLSSKVTLTNGDVAFAAGTYYVAILSGTYSEGLLFTFTNNEGLQVVKGISKNMVLNAGDVANIGTVGTLDFVDNADNQLKTNTIYQENGVNLGVVFWVDPLNPNKGMIVSRDGSKLAYASSDVNIKTDLPINDMLGNDCSINDDYILNLEGTSAEKFPAVYFCKNLGEGWHMPAAIDIENLAKAYYGLDTVPTDMTFEENPAAMNAAASFNELLAQCHLVHSDSGLDVSKVNFGLTNTTVKYWTGQGDVSSGATDPKIKTVNIQNKFAIGATRSIKTENYVRCVREVEIK